MSNALAWHCPPSAIILAAVHLGFMEQARPQFCQAMAPMQPIGCGTLDVFFGVPEKGLME
jgi:hypothetical protein